MPRLTNSHRSYRKHRASGQAVVALSGQDVYLGAHGSAASKREYDRVVGEWLARGRQLPAAVENVRVADVVAAYWEYASVYYGTPERLYRLSSIKRALALLRRSYGETPAVKFGPLALQTVRAAMIKEDWSRHYVNEQIGRGGTDRRPRRGWQEPAGQAETKRDQRKAAPRSSPKNLTLCPRA
jgi:hypothetical protein